MLCALALALPAALGAAPADVLVVAPAPGPGVDFVDIGAAVAAANPSDVVLVRSGTYGGFTIDRSIAVLADTGATVVTGPVLVSGVPPGEQVVVRGLQMQSGGSTPPLRVSGVASEVWLEDCELGPNSGSSLAWFDAARVSNSASVTFLRCTLQSGGSSSWVETVGLRSTSSRVQLWDCVVIGGEGASDGGDGALVSGGELFASGTTFRGGAGADAYCWECSFCNILAGSGGTGLKLEGAAATVLDCTFVGGAGGAPDPVCPAGLAGAPVAGALTTLEGNARHFAVTPVVRETQSATLQIDGEPGDVMLLAVGLAQDTTPDFAFLNGTRLISPLLLVPLGTVPPSGTLTLPVPFGSLGSGVDALVLFGQSVHLAPPKAFLGPGSVLAVVDAAL